VVGGELVSEVPGVGEEGALDAPRLLLLDAADVAGRAREVMAPGVSYTVLWRDGRDVAGVLWIAGGAEIAEHVHSRAEHHVWLIEGRARVAGRTFEGRAYWHVPPGVPHAIEGVEPDGCTLFYLYVVRSGSAGGASTTG
jgi:mannose-6-phosphate isomerase-like protein (cupin superfamily)